MLRWQVAEPVMLLFPIALFDQSSNLCLYDQHLLSSFLGQWKWDAGFFFRLVTLVTMLSFLTFTDEFIVQLSFL